MSDSPLIRVDSLLHPLVAVRIAAGLGRFHVDRPLHLAIGMFDGLHRGHQAVLRSALTQAVESGGWAAVLTFHPHPSKILRPDQATRLMMPLRLKCRLLSGCGVRGVIVERFSEQFARLPADRFVRLLKDRLPALASIHVGENFRFGQGRVGTVEVLDQTARESGVTVCAIPRQMSGTALISSSRLRDLVQAGAMEEVGQLLGYPYLSQGLIHAGRHLARTLNFPTMNQPWRPELPPRYGVYGVRFHHPSLPIGQWVPGIANYGLRPTVEETARKPVLEVHSFQPILAPPGDSLTVQWLHFLRPEMKFPSLQALQTQISQDVLIARQRLAC